MFSEQEINGFKADGLTDEEIETLLDAVALQETIEMVPDDLEAFIREYEERVPLRNDGGISATRELAEKDPEFFAKVIALDIAMASVIGQTEPVKDENTIITNLPEEDRKTFNRNYLKTMINVKDSDRKQFLDLIANLTEEQKKDMVERLKRK